MTLAKVGVYCLRGDGHWACYDEDDAAACGTKGPDVFIDIDAEDLHMYPQWLRQVAQESGSGEMPAGGVDGTTARHDSSPSFTTGSPHSDAGRDAL